VNLFLHNFILVPVASSPVAQNTLPKRVYTRRIIIEWFWGCHGKIYLGKLTQNEFWCETNNRFL
jgi:hypothetical protein